MKTTRYTSLAAIALLLSGCSISNQTFAYRGGEAGSEVTSGNFGLATANNVAVQSGDLAGSMTANLTRKFASEAPSSINFAFNSAELDETARRKLAQQARWIKAHPKIVFRVYGHTDKVGSARYNKSLGKRRAVAAVNYMVSLGVSRSKLQAVASFGETRPIVSVQGPNRQNRRTITEVSGFGTKTQSHSLDGKYAALVYDKYITTTYKVASDAKE